MKTIAVDFGGTTIKIGLVQDGKILKYTSIPAYSEHGLLPRLGDTEAVIRELTDNALAEYKGIGIALPTLVDPKNKCMVEIYGKYEDAIGFNLEKWCMERFQLPTAVEMDSKAALLGEMNYGCAQGAGDVVIVIMGTGVGTAVALDHKLLDSHSHQVGALASHFIIEMNGRKCTCKGQGCLEAYTGGWALPLLIKEHEHYESSGLSQEQELNFEILKKWVEREDRVALDVFQQFVTALRTGIISMITAYDPEVVVLSGGVMNMGTMLLEPLTEGINDLIWNNFGGPVRFEVALEPDSSVILGLHQLVCGL